MGVAMIPSQRPLVSIVLDGYNETRLLGTASNTIEAVKRQHFPLDQVELIIAASPDQIKALEERYPSAAPFMAIKYVAVADGQYYRLKNSGAKLASGDIIAFTDSDVCPQEDWLSSIVQTISNGSDASVGLSLFKRANGWEPGGTLRDIAVSITFGYILGKISEKRLPRVRGFMDHNIAFRADLYRRFPYREDQGRVCASPLLFRVMNNSGGTLQLHPNQQVVHYFSWWYWLTLHFRYGYEVYQLRRLDRSYPKRWIASTGIFEGVLTLIWHMLLNQPRWLRFSELRGYGLFQRIVLLPLVGILSFAANSSEMFGIYATMLRPKAMKRWSEEF